MSSAFACCTLFFNTASQDIIERYEAEAEPADGYLAVVGEVPVLMDASATETADWARQTQLAASLTSEGGVALSVFIGGESWALALADSGKAGPVVVSVPEDAEVLEKLPFKLLEFENALLGIFPDLLDADEVDSLFGAMVEGAVNAEDGINDLLTMLDVAPDWQRWSWYETIPEQLLLDPDLAERVTPLGQARAFWEE